MKDFAIRRENESDYRAVEELTRNAFWNVYRPGCAEHYLIHTLRESEGFIPELDLVMEVGGELIGHIAFFKARLYGDDMTERPIAIFGPISIKPDLQRMGYGKALLDHALEKAKNMGVGAVCIEGNIDFYGKCGFVTADRFNVYYNDVARDVPLPFFLAKELKEGYLDGFCGTYRTPSAYILDEDKIEEFDKSFEFKEKLALPTQIFD